MEVRSSTEVGAQVPRIWERETTDPKPTEGDHHLWTYKVIKLYRPVGRQPGSNDAIGSTGITTA
jgi:hypothetical protein